MGLLKLELVKRKRREMKKTMLLEHGRLEKTHLGLDPSNTTQARELNSYT
jgi:hypothetical protein